MADERFKVLIEASDRYSAQFSKFNAGIGRMTSGVVRFGAALAGAFAVKAAVDFGKELVRVQRRFDAIDATFRSVTGSSAAAEAAFDDAAGMADKLGLDVVSTATSFAQFNAAAKGTALEGDAARDIFESLSLAAAALQLDAHDTRGAMRALEQMISKGNVQAEELRGQLGERLPGAFQLAARAMRVTTSELNDMLENGEVLAQDLLPELAGLLRERYTEGAEEGAQSLNGDINRLNNSLNELKLNLSELVGVETIVEGIAFSVGFLADVVKGANVEIDRIQAAVVSGNIREQIESIDKQIEQRRAFEPRLGTERFLASLQEEDRQALQALERERRRLTIQLELANAALREAFDLSDTAPEVGEKFVKPNAALRFMDKRRDFFEAEKKKFLNRQAEFARELDRLRPPIQIYTDDIGRYEAALADNVITQEQFNQLVVAARDRFLETSPALQAQIEKQEALAAAQEEAAQAQQDAFELFSDLDPFVAYANAVRELTDAFNLLTPEQLTALGGAERVREVLNEEIAKLGEPFDQLAEAQQDAFELFSDLDPLVAYANAVRELTDAFNLLTEEQIAALGGTERVQEVLDEQITRLRERLDEVTKSGELFAGLEEGLAGAITRGVTDGADSALQVFTNLLQTMATRALQSQLESSLSGMFTSGLLGGLLGSIGGGGSAPIDPMADGGTVTGGRTYLVGERGPELFTAGRTGTITPNNAMMGGLTYAPVVTINGGATEEDRIFFQRQLEAQKAEIFDLARRGRL